MKRGVAATLLLLLFVLPACRQGETGQEIDFYMPVSVRPVATGTVEDRIVGTGTLRAAESVALRADTSGVVRAGRAAGGRRLAEGDRVDPGQVVVEMTGEEVKLAARSEATHRRYVAAQADHRSKQELYERGLISELEFRPVETELANAKLEWERSRLTESRSRLETPIAGVILRLLRDEQGLPMADGQLVAQGREVAQIAPTDKLIADVDIVGPDVSRVEPGMSARVRHQAWEGENFGGRLVRLAPTLDPATRALRAEVEVLNPRGLLRPGMFVEVTLVIARREEVPVVPREAVTERGGVRVVFVLSGQRVSQREVTTGLGDDDEVEIRGGLEVGERIVVRGLETLVDGTKVRVTGA